MITHEEISQQAVQTVREADVHAITAAFVASLSSRNLPARSAFGSYVVLQHFAQHDFAASVFAGDNCASCGLPEQSDASEIKERVLCYPFQVHHPDINYAAYDLDTFHKRIVDVPTNEDIERLQKLFDALRSLPATAQLGDLNKSLQNVIKSNKHERMILLETLGYAGILCPDNQQNYADGFVSYDFANLQQPPHFYKREWAYPVRFWSGADGVNEDKIKHYFGAFL